MQAPSLSVVHSASHRPPPAGTASCVVQCCWDTHLFLELCHLLLEAPRLAAGSGHLDREPGAIQVPAADVDDARKDEFGRLMKEAHPDTHSNIARKCVHQYNTYGMRMFDQHAYMLKPPRARIFCCFNGSYSV